LPSTIAGLRWRSINREETMQFPQRVVLTRDGSHEHTPGIVVALPGEGEVLQLFLDNGRVLRTSQVTHVEEDDAEVIVDTLNSRYHLELAS
jgi:hypothetical protein